MKQNLIVAALVTGALSTAAFADDGEIQFYGVITDTACTIVNPVGTPLEVTLGTVSRTAFSDGNRTAAPTKFTILLTDCPQTLDGTNAQVKFDGTADSTDNSLLALTQETGVAKNVAIQLMDKDQQIVPLFTASSSYPLVEGNNSLDFIARYYATGADGTPTTVVSGLANATSNFTIIYN